MYIKAARSKNKKELKLFFMLLRGSVGSIFMSLFAQILSCLSQQTDVSGKCNAMAIGPSLPKVKISRSQSFASNPTQDGVVLFSSYFFSFFLIFVLLNWPRGVLEFF